MNPTFTRNCVYQTAYHVVWCPKYRKAVLTGEVARRTQGLVEAICAERGWPLHTLEIQPDHLHLFVSLPPAVSLANAARILKGTTARKLFVAFPALREELPGGHLWSPSYYVGTAGAATAEAIQAYIERAAHIRGRR